MNNDEETLCNCANCDCVFLFLYGSLKQGGWLNHYIENMKKKNFGYVAGELLDQAIMYDLGEFPAINLGNPNRLQLANIKGEIVKLPAKCLLELDVIESNMYKREILQVKDESGVIRECVVYCWQLGEEHFNADMMITRGEWVV